MTINLEKTLVAILKHFHRIEKERSLQHYSEVFVQLVQLLKTVKGCSYILCIKRFFNLVKKNHKKISGYKTDR